MPLLNQLSASGTSRAAMLAVAAVLGGCATFSDDGGFGAIESIAKERLGQSVRWQRSDADAQAVREALAPLLAKPLSVDDAVQIALLNNPGLQATYAELGVAEADLVQAGRLRNPHYAILRTKRGNDVEKVEEAMSLEIISLLTLPLRARMEARRFERVQRDVGERMLRVAHDARKAYVQALAAEELARYMAQVHEAAEASAELARRMARAGNFPKLTQMREHAFYAEATANLARARHGALAEREKLTRLMGLYGADAQFKLPERLPDLPAALPERQDLESTALRDRLDVQAVRRDTESLAQSLGLTQFTRFVNVLEVGRARTREGDHPFAYGYEISLEIPLFDWGGAKVARAEALYMQSVHRVAEVAVNARSEVREAYSAYRTAYDTARHYRDEIVPLKKQIGEEQLLRYNGMLISVFELLADARDQVSAVSTYIEALREFWVAESNLRMALSVGSPGAMSMAGARTTPAASTGGH